MTPSWIRPLFLVAALFDGVLGVAVLLFARPIFALFGVEPPNHLGYVQFPAMLLIVFAAMFVRIANDPVSRRDLIPYGIGLKLAYTISVFWHELTGGVPWMWIPWAWADVVFLVLFVIAWRQTKPAR
ncbi:MAG: hypothetical protein IT184_15780 [Acidobacteria bacterium]|nr:hypothetical protein [Acidobacteriota bacterium]